MLGKLFSGGTDASSAQLPLSFSMAGRRELRFELFEQDEHSADHSLQIWRFLSHYIRRYPHDLRAHVQRILLTQQAALQDRMAGSLLDLFLALGDAGQMLRVRMLGFCAEQLPTETCQLFSDWLEQGADEENTGWFNGSMLARGDNPPVRRLLKQQRSQPEPEYTDVLAEVQDHLEYGQIELAQELLETEILGGRGTPELEEELLTVYQHTRNRNRLEEFVHAMITADIEVAESWHEMRERAVNW